MQRYDVAIVASEEYPKRALRRALAVRARRMIAHSESRETLSGLSDSGSEPGDEMHEVERMIELLRPLGVALPTAVLDGIYPGCFITSAEVAQELVFTRNIEEVSYP